MTRKEARSTQHGEVGSRLRDYREAADLSQTELARLTGVKREYISSIELGRIQVLYPETFRALHRALGFPAEVLLEAMGYPVGVGSGGINPALAAAVRGLDDRQQRALLGLLLAFDVATPTSPRSDSNGGKYVEETS